MWRDFWLYLQALIRHWATLVTGTVISLGLIIWHDVLTREGVPTPVLWVSAVLCFFGAGFRVWREEHTKVVLQGGERRREKQNRLRDLADKMVEEYLHLARPHRDAGPHALATLGLEALKSDALIREAIDEMKQRSGEDPWQGWRHHVEDVDLVSFFRLVREKRFNFQADGTVEDIAKQVRAAGGYRR